jgi:release factor glutamine methyltransferase
LPERTVRGLLSEARRVLAASPLPIPQREAALLLGHALGWSEAQVLARDERPVTEEEAAETLRLAARRAAGEPSAYLFGEREFYGRPFYVDSRVLIPRPETEHVVEEALALDLPPAPRILDVGTGSGCLAVTLALEIPGAFVVGVDLSAGALAVAQKNARRLGAARTAWASSDLTAALALASFDLVVSNPPYIDPRDAAMLSPEVCNFEPHLALFSPGTGESILERLFSESAGLGTGTSLIVEIGYGQSGPVLSLAEAHGLAPVRVRADYAGIPRTLIFHRS